MCNKEPQMPLVALNKALTELTEFIETRADRISERETKKEIAQIEAPVELVKGVLTFAVLVAVVFCVGVPLVVLVCGRGIGWSDWQATLTCHAIHAGICMVVLAVVIAFLVMLFKIRRADK